MIESVKSMWIVVILGLFALVSLTCVAVDGEYGGSELAAVGQAQGVGKVFICHIPPGNPDNPQEIMVGAPAVPAHEAHGDVVGSCDDVCFSETPPRICDEHEWCDETEGCVPILEDCGDQMDNDGDGYIDCDDDECFGDPACGPECDCDESVDFDANCWAGTGDAGSEACEDMLGGMSGVCGYPECTYCFDSGSCDDCFTCNGYVAENICDDVDENGNPIDNDGDGLMNCDDTDCAEDPACAPD